MTTADHGDRLATLESRYARLRAATAAIALGGLGNVGAGLLR